MFRLKENKLPRVFITVFTVLAVMVSFCLGTAEPLRDAGFRAEETGSVRGGIDSFIPSPVREPLLLIKTEDHQLTSPGTEFQRIFNPWGTHGADSGFPKSRFKTSGVLNRLDYINVKNSILLKLRI
jgi:hypothetical protein